MTISHYDNMTIDQYENEIMKRKKLAEGLGTHFVWC